MDYSERDRTRDETGGRASNWLGLQGGERPGGRSFLPRFISGYGGGGWLVNIALLVIFCGITAAIGTEIFREWRPGIFLPGSPLSGLSPLPAVVPKPRDLQASGVTPGRSALAMNMELEMQARRKAQEENEQRRAAAVKQNDADEAAARRRAELEARREREWRASYVKPAHCDESLPTVDSIGCANDYIRARRKFDEQFLASTRR